jgi:hypothetical protein
MATGRIGVTPTLGVRWSKAPAGGTTSLSGLDDNSVSLVYSVGYEQVYRNGVLLSRTNDYTATNGTTITLVDATIAGDIIEVFANELVPLTDAISKGQFNAKGALLSATAASTPGVLAVGSNNQVLTADSSTATGLKWATPATGAMVLINRTSISAAATTTVDNLFSDTYENYYLVLNYGVSTAGNNGILKFRYATTTHSAGYYHSALGAGNGGTLNSNFYGHNVANISFPQVTTGSNFAYSAFIQRSSTASKQLIGYHYHNDYFYNNVISSGGFIVDSSQAWSGIELTTNAGTLTGVLSIYGLAKS